MATGSEVGKRPRGWVGMNAQQARSAFVRVNRVKWGDQRWGARVLVGVPS